MTKRDEILRGGLASLGLMFNREIPRQLADAYWLALRDLSGLELSAAFARALAECKFMPAAAELRGFAGRATNVSGNAVEAWGAVRRAIDKHDYTDSVDFGVLVNACVRSLGGWLRLCDLKREELDVWAHKEFERVYVELSAKDPAWLAGDPLIGTCGKLIVRIPIGGKLPPRALPPVETPQSKAMHDEVRELAESKSQVAPNTARPVSSPGAAVELNPAERDARPEPAPSRSAAPPLREQRTPVRITEDEKVAAIARMTEQLAARGAST